MGVQNNRILEAIAQGKDESAIAGLYDKSFRKIRDYIRKNSGNTEDAEDIFQDAVLILFKQIKEGKFNMELELDGFLFSVSRNLWINKAKRDQRILHLKEGYDSVEIEQHPVFTNEREERIRQVFEKVGDKCKQLLILVIYFDHSMKEICEKIGFPNENAAKTQHYKCKQKLIELVGANSEFKNLLKNAD